MKKIQFALLSILLLFGFCVLSENGVKESLYEEYSYDDLASLINDLYTGGFYCGSDNDYHYMIVNRQLIFPIKYYVKIKTDEVPPIKTINFSTAQENWLKLNGAFHHFGVSCFSQNRIRLLHEFKRHEETK